MRRGRTTTSATGAGIGEAHEPSARVQTRPVDISTRFPTSEQMVLTSHSNGEDGLETHDEGLQNVAGGEDDCVGGENNKNDLVRLPILRRGQRPHIWKVIQLKFKGMSECGKRVKGTSGFGLRTQAERYMENGASA